MANEALFVVNFGSQTGLAEDVTVNNWVCKNVITNTDADDVIARLAQFYDDIDDLMSHTISGTGTDVTVDVYSLIGHLDGSPHGSPIYSSILGWGAARGSDGFPAEVALALTLEGVGRSTALTESGSTRPKQRRTGRVYLGPLARATAEEAGGKVRPSAAVIDRILDAAVTMEAGLASDGQPLCVWSRANAAVYELEALSMDNAFDTIRSRGEAPTTRDRRSV